MANPKHVAKLKEGVDAWHKWLVERDEQGRIDLEGADLHGAKLGGAMLIGANMQHAILIGADLSVAQLNNADLRGAKLLHADLRGAILRGADLRGSDLQEADLNGANLSGADLRKANLVDLILYDANVHRANLSHARLENVTLTSDFHSDPLTFHGAGEARSRLEELGAYFSSTQNESDVLSVIVDPGSAPPEEIADILSDLSILYRKMGGSGINFSLLDIHTLEGKTL